MASIWSSDWCKVNIDLRNCLMFVYANYCVLLSLLQMLPLGLPILCQTFLQNLLKFSFMARYIKTEVHDKDVYGNHNKIWNINISLKNIPLAQGDYMDHVILIVGWDILICLG